MRRIALTLIMTTLAAGTASARQTAIAQADIPQAGFDPSATIFTGWIRISQGEFQLYGEQRQLAEPFARPCVSGALPRGLQRSAGDLSGTQVTLTGRAVPWANRQTAHVLNHAGSRIVNECRGVFVIEADTVRVDRAG
ncbi:hypothetical protein BH10PSE2_BH10PSE2_16620 [soil metagenome]